MKKFLNGLLKIFLYAILGVCVFGLGFSVICAWPSGSGWNVAFVWLFAGSVGFTISSIGSCLIDLVIKCIKCFSQKSPSDEEVPE